MVKKKVVVVVVVVVVSMIDDVHLRSMMIGTDRV